MLVRLKVFINPNRDVDMNSRPEIFLITAVLLVPFLYYTTSLAHDVCALPPSSGYSHSDTCGARTTNSETGESKQTCCWKQRTGTSMGPGPEKMVCQTCSSSGNGLSCDAPVTQAIKSPGTIRPDQNAGVQDEPSTSPKLGGGLIPKTGGIFEDPITTGSNATNVTMP